MQSNQTKQTEPKQPKQPKHPKQPKQPKQPKHQDPNPSLSLSKGLHVLNSISTLSLDEMPYIFQFFKFSWLSFTHPSLMCTCKDFFQIVDDEIFYQMENAFLGIYR